MATNSQSQNSSEVDVTGVGPVDPHLFGAEGTESISLDLSREFSLARKTRGNGLFAFLFVFYYELYLGLLGRGRIGDKLALEPVQTGKLACLAVVPASTLVTVALMYSPFSPLWLVLVMCGVVWSLWKTLPGTVSPPSSCTPGYCYLALFRYKEDAVDLGAYPRLMALRQNGLVAAALSEGKMVQTVSISTNGQVLHLASSGMAGKTISVHRLLSADSREVSRITGVDWDKMTTVRVGGDQPADHYTNPEYDPDFAGLDADDDDLDDGNTGRLRLAPYLYAPQRQDTSWFSVELSTQRAISNNLESIANRSIRAVREVTGMFATLGSASAASLVQGSEKPGRCYQAMFDEPVDFGVYPTVEDIIWNKDRTAKTGLDAFGRGDIMRLVHFRDYGSHFHVSLAPFDGSQPVGRNWVMMKFLDDQEKRVGADLPTGKFVPKDWGVMDFDYLHQNGVILDFDYTRIPDDHRVPRIRLDMPLSEEEALFRRGLRPVDVANYVRAGDGIKGVGRAMYAIVIGLITALQALEALIVLAFALNADEPTLNKEGFRPEPVIEGIDNTVSSPPAASTLPCGDKCPHEIALESLARHTVSRVDVGEIRTLCGHTHDDFIAPGSCQRTCGHDVTPAAARLTCGHSPADFPCNHDTDPTNPSPVAAALTAQPYIRLNDDGTTPVLLVNLEDPGVGVIACNLCGALEFYGASGPHNGDGIRTTCKNDHLLVVDDHTIGDNATIIKRGSGWTTTVRRVPPSRLRKRVPPRRKPIIPKTRWSEPERADAESALDEFLGLETPPEPAIRSPPRPSSPVIPGPSVPVIERAAPTVPTPPPIRSPTASAGSSIVSSTSSYRRTEPITGSNGELVAPVFDTSGRRSNTVTDGYCYRRLAKEGTYAKRVLHNFPPWPKWGTVRRRLSRVDPAQVVEELGLFYHNGVCHFVPTTYTGARIATRTEIMSVGFINDHTVVGGVSASVSASSMATYKVYHPGMGHIRFAQPGSKMEQDLLSLGPWPTFDAILAVVQDDRSNLRPVYQGSDFWTGVYRALELRLQDTENVAEATAIATDEVLEVGIHETALAGEVVADAIDIVTHPFSPVRVVEDVADMVEAVHTMDTLTEQLPIDTTSQFQHVLDGPLCRSREQAREDFEAVTDWVGGAAKGVGGFFMSNFF